MKKTLMICIAVIILFGIGVADVVVTNTPIADWSAYSEWNNTEGIPAANAGNYYGTNGVGILNGGIRSIVGRNPLTPNQLHRSFITFELDDSLVSSNILSATLYFTGRSVQGSWDSDVSVYHSQSYNVGNTVAAFEESSFDSLVAEFTPSATAFSFDVTAQIKSDYDHDSSEVIHSVFKLQLSNESAIYATSGGGAPQYFDVYSTEDSLERVAYLVIEQGETVSESVIIEGADFVEDSWVNKVSGNEDVNYGSQGDMRIRGDNSSYEQGCLIRFDLSAIPTNAVIDQARIRLWRTTTNVNTMTQVNGYALEGTWDEDLITWNNMPTYSSSMLAVLAPHTVTSVGWEEFDISDIARLWQNGLLENNGVYIRYVDFESGTAVHSFVTSDTSNLSVDPRLVVDYSMDAGFASTGICSFAGIKPVSSSVIKLLFSSDGDLSSQKLVSKNNLLQESWSNVTTSDTISGPFVETNLTLSVSEGTNYAVFVESTNSAAFFGIQ
jgi:hypothetical protein